MTTEERASRVKVMMALRSWMDSSGTSRRDVAEVMGITVGHLSTLINANRIPSEEQVAAAKLLMDGAEKSAPLISDVSAKKSAPNGRSRRKPANPKIEPTITSEPSKKTGLRPLTEAEGGFVASVAKAWLNDHKNATKEEYLEIVRALSVAIRS